MEKMETDQEKSELNKLNVQLVEKLRSSDNAFSLGESIDGLACIRYIILDKNINFCKQIVFLDLVW